MAVPKELLYIIGSYLVVFIIPFFLVALYQGGFFGPYVRVKGSRGKLVLVKVRTMVSHYYRVGRIVEGALKYRDRNKNDHHITLIEGCVYRMLGVSCIDVDEEKSTVYNHALAREVPGHDTVKVDQHIKRALQKPSMTNQNWTIILLIVILVALIGVGILMYQNYKLQKTGLELAAKTYELLRAMQPAVTPTPGVA